jgi:ATP dependent DNA ligase C terminal region
MADKGNDLVYAGKVGHGFDKKSSADLRKRLTPLIRKTQPYTKRIAQKGIWVEPELLAEIEYRAKSAQGPRACGRIYDKSTSPTETRLSVYGTLTKGRNFLLGQNKETHMSSKTIALVAAFVLSSSMALAQSGQGKAGSDNGPTSAPTTSGSMNRYRRRHENEKEQVRENEKEHDRKLQRREHSRRGYSWSRAKKGRRYYARRHHETAMTPIVSPDPCAKASNHTILGA